MEVRPGYKQTEVGVIPEDWATGLLVNFAEIRTGIAKNSNNAVSDPVLVHYLRVANVQDGYLDLADMRKIRVSSHEIRHYAVLPGDLLMNEGGDLDKLGRGAIWRGAFSPCVHQNHVFVVRCGSRVSAPYLNAWTASSPARRYFMVAGKQTTNLASINKTALGRLPIAVPPFTEQEAIAEALSDADALIESLEQLLAKKGQIKQGAMQVLLTGKKRLPGFERKPSYKQSDVGVVPGEWEVRRLGEGIRLTSGQHVLAKYCNTDGDGVPYITGPADFPNGAIQLTKHTTRPGTLCGVDDILITVKGSGSGSLVRTDAVYSISRQLMAIDVLGWNTDFVFFSLLRDSYLFSAAATGLIPGLSRSDILNKKVPMPPTGEEQTAIATVLTDMDAEIAALEAKLVKARQLKQGMMQELLTGRIRLV